MKINLDFSKNKDVDLETPFVKQIIKGVLSAVGNSPAVVNLSVALVSDAVIKKLNKQYRRQDKITDVLSFSGQVAGFMDWQLDLGEIIIATGQCWRQARQNGHSFAREFTYLLIHGVLHLLGFDHEEKSSALIMEKLEKKILDKVYG